MSIIFWKILCLGWNVTTKGIPFSVLLFTFLFLSSSTILAKKLHDWLWCHPLDGWLWSVKINLWEASFLILFSNIFFWYIKLPKDLSAKCYRNNKERLRKKLVKNIEVFLKKKKGNMVMNNVTSYQEVKNKNWLSIEKYKIRKKALFYLINYYRLEKFWFFLF